ncbi:Endoglucanase gh5-1 [Fusarium oxysporum f. sp. albedinis]|nr:Endoglucanase gh5-1 [Fusarium oxysporum f. sp. albedinis]
MPIITKTESAYPRISIRQAFFLQPINAFAFWRPIAHCDFSAAAARCWHFTSPTVEKFLSFCEAFLLRGNPIAD